MWAGQLPGKYVPRTLAQMLWLGYLLITTVTGPAVATRDDRSDFGLPDRRCKPWSRKDSKESVFCRYEVSVFGAIRPP